MLPGLTHNAFVNKLRKKIIDWQDELLNVFFHKCTPMPGGSKSKKICITKVKRKTFYTFYFNLLYFHKVKIHIILLFIFKVIGRYT